jgi:perosamine synthetase
MIRVFDARMTDADSQAAADCVSSNWVGPGPRVAQFEELIAAATGKSNAICCNSGTTALMLCMLQRAYLHDITNRVRVPAYGMHAAAEMAQFLKHRVEPYDIGVVPEDTGYDLCVALNQNGIPSTTGYDIEDACQSLGIEGAFQNELCTLSFSPQKIVTTGQGGAVVTDDDAAAEAIRNLIDHGGGWRETRIHERIGGNWRMADLNAAIGVSQMRRLPELIEQRHRVHLRYQSHLGERVECGWCVTIRSLNPKSFIEHLRERGVEALQPYKPLHHHPPFDSFESFPNAERAARELVYLPGHPHLTDDEVDHICRSIEEFE